LSLRETVRSYILGCSRTAIVAWTVTSSAILSFLLNVIQSYMRWGRISWDIITIGTIDSVLIAALLAPVIISFVHEIVLLDATAKSNERIRKNESLYRLLAENISDIIWIRNLATGRFTYVSPSVKRVRGLSVEEALAENLNEVVTPESFKMVQVRIQRRIELIDEGIDGPYVDVLEQYRRDGTTFWTEVRTKYRRNPETNDIEVFGVTRDISERRLAEGELLKLRKAINASSESIFMTDDQGIITFVNPAFTKLYGYDQEELVGKETPRVLKSGSMDEEDYRKFWNTILSKSVAQDQITNKTKDGRLLSIESSVNPILDDTGTIVGFLAIQRDITERKLVEERRIELERQLLHTQRLESLGVLAGGIAHDFNNLLVAILGHASLVKSRLTPPDKNISNLERLERSAERASELVRQMLAYSGRGRFQITHLSVNDLIRENAELLRTGIPRSISLTTDLSREDLFVDADRGQMQQIVMNLITNAAEAIGEKGGTITLSTGLVMCSEEDLLKSRVPEKPAPGRFLFIQSKDTGCGMDTETQARMFDPFFTTKFTGRGLGLSAAQGIVKSHRGAIFVNSSPGEGTTIRVLFPVEGDAASADGQSESVSVPAAESVRFWGTILVVDDEEFVLELAREIVEELGFRSLGARDGVEAVELYERHAGEISCVLLDLTMPRKDGVETFKDLQRLSPGLKVILSSGFSEQEVAGKFRESGLSGFVQKPYRFDDLKGKLTQVFSR